MFAWLEYKLIPNNIELDFFLTDTPWRVTSLGNPGSAKATRFCTLT